MGSIPEILEPPLLSDFAMESSPCFDDDGADALCVIRETPASCPSQKQEPRQRTLYLDVIPQPPIERPTAEPQEYPSSVNSRFMPQVPNMHVHSPGADGSTKQIDPFPLLSGAPHQGSNDVDPATSDYYETNKPTCSLNLVCYRAGSGGCHPQQIQCTLRSRYSNERFNAAIKANPSLVFTDDQLFSQMKRLFEKEIQGFIRRHLSLKTLKALRVLAYTPTTRPAVIPLDDFVLHEMMYAYQNPEKLGKKDFWIQWVFKLRQKDKRHAIEFVEGWDSARIAMAAMIPWLGSCVVGIGWTMAGGDPQTTFTVAGFILTSSSILLALLAIVSSIE